MKDFSGKKCCEPGKSALKKIEYQVKLQSNGHFNFMRQSQTNIGKRYRRYQIAQSRPHMNGSMSSSFTQFDFLGNKSIEYGIIRR